MSAMSVDIPPYLLEGVIFGLLLILTLFRRRISVNDEYRDRDDVDDIISSSLHMHAASAVACRLQSADAAAASAAPGDDYFQGLLGPDFALSAASAAPSTHHPTSGPSSPHSGAPKFAHGLGLWKRPSFSRFYNFDFAAEMQSLDYVSFIDATFSGTETFFASDGATSGATGARVGDGGSARGGAGASGSPKGRDKISSLQPELLLQIVSYLPQQDIGPLSSASRVLAKDVKSDFVWEQLWIAAYGAMWGSENIRALREKRAISWDPLGRNGPRRAPAQGWFVFYLEFEACWLDWLLAGCCTKELCVIGLGGSIYDITAFLPMHPGSEETLAEACGGDGTERFADIGHSSDAVDMAAKYCVCLMPESLTCGQYQEPSKINRHRGSRRGYATKFQSTMKREQQLAEVCECRCNIRRAGAAEGLGACAATAIAATPAAAPAAAPASGLGPGPSQPDDVAEKAEKDRARRLRQVSPKVGGYFDCPEGEPHFGRARACYDPVEQQWIVWWTCCGRYVLSGTPRSVATKC